MGSRQPVTTVSKRRLFWRQALTLGLGGCVVGLALLEVALRIFAVPSPYQPDDRMGWRTTPDFHHVFTQSTMAGVPYSVDYSTQSHGQRVYRTGPGQAVSVLVVGDSFTMDPNAGDDAMWYAVFADALADYLHRPVAVTAIGGGGYSSLQELMAVEALRAREGAADYAILIQQVCDNDVVENHLSWIAAMAPVGAALQRPYLAGSETDAVVYMTGWHAVLVRAMTGSIRLVAKLEAGVAHRVLLAHMADAGTQGAHEFLGQMLITDALGYADEAFAMTRRLLGRVRAAHPAARAFTVGCNAGPPALQARWNAVAQDAGFIPLTRPPAAVAEAEQAGQTVRTADRYHFDAVGNRIFGQAVFAESRPHLEVIAR